MAIGGKIKLEGAKELVAKLEKLEANIQKKILKNALRLAIEPIANAAQARAPIETGALRSAIRVRAMTRMRQGTVGVKVDLRGGVTGEQFYGSFQEFGFKVGRRALGSQRTQIPGKHFLEIAFNTNKEFALSIFEREVKSAIEQEAAA